MKLKVNFNSKLTKAKSVNEIIFVKNKNLKNNLNLILKAVIENQLFEEELFIQKEHKNKKSTL